MEQYLSGNILLVDDEAVIRDSVKLMLRNTQYKVFGAESAKSAMQLFEMEAIDAVICDVKMPEIGGIELLEYITKNYPVVPVIMLTGYADVDTAVTCLKKGAFEFLSKPLKSDILKINIMKALEQKFLREEKRRLEEENKIYQNKLEELVKERTASLEQNAQELRIALYQVKKSNTQINSTQDATIIGLAKLAEYRDPETGGHLNRIRNYARMLANELSKLDKYKYKINESYLDSIYKSSPLHDIGKVGIPDSILLKAGKLDEEELKIMKKHTLFGGDVIDQVEKTIDNYGNTFLTMGKAIAYCHHEKWNGEGYPFGLVKEGIPLAARIMAVVDNYDALISKRTYKEAFRHEVAIETIFKNRGTHFDPNIVDAFLRIEKDLPYVEGGLI